jgi:hypothetical protein
MANAAIWRIRGQGSRRVSYDAVFASDERSWRLRTLFSPTRGVVSVVVYRPQKVDEPLPRYPEGA